jgi:oligopeptide transport system substrate-binding protein
LKKNLFTLVGISLSALLLLNGCSISSLNIFDSSSDTGSGANLSISISGNPKSLDPQTASDENSRTVICNIFEGLMKINQDGELVKGVAESYSVSDDNLTYTFKIRSDARWFFDENADNYMDDDEFTDVTADDFVFAFQRIFNPETESPYKETFSFLENGEDIIKGSKKYTEIGVYAQDDDTVVFKLDKPDAYFLNLLSSSSAMPCNEEFFYSTKGRYGLDDRSINSNGPFFIQQWYYDEYGKNNFMYIHRNSSYNENETVYPKLITLNIKNSEDALTSDYSDGDSSLLITDDYNSRFVNSKSNNSVEYQFSTIGLIFNTENKFTKNSDFRKALRYAIDISAVSDSTSIESTIGNGVIPPAVSLLGRSYRELYSDNDLYINQNTEKAKELYNNILKNYNSQTVDGIKLLVCSNSINSLLIGEIINQWKEVLDLNVSIEEVSSDDYISKLNENDYTIAVYELTSDMNSPEDFISQFVKEDNVFGADSSELNSIYSEILSESDLSNCISLYGKAEKEIIDESLFYPLFYKSCYVVTPKKVEDVVYDPFNKQVYWQYIKKYS